MDYMSLVERRKSVLAMRPSQVLVLPTAPHKDEEAEG